MGDEEEAPSIGRNCKNYWGYHRDGIITLLTPIAFLPILILKFDEKEFRCIYLVLVMATYWITETIPLHITSMIPIFALPLMGITSSTKVCSQYFKSPLVMFLGGLIVAEAIEYCNLHKRVALGTIILVGCSPRRLHFGLITVTAFISMWVSNSAATAMMCPIIRAVLDELELQKVIKIYIESDDKEADKKPRPSTIAIGYYLSAAYAATIGGCATLIGTGTNVTFKGIYDSYFVASTDNMDFPIFMAYAFPLVVCLTITLFFSMQFTHFGLFRPNSTVGQEIRIGTENSGVLKNVVKQKYSELGPVSMHEFQVIIVFMLMVILLFTMNPGFIPGWADFFNAVIIKNSFPVVVCVLILFLFPKDYMFCKLLGGSGPFERKETSSLIGWKYVHDNTPWALVFLLGGGYALALGSTESGMAKMLGESLQVLSAIPKPAVQFLVIAVSMFMTAFSSNVAIANIITPILCEMSISVKVHPLYLIFPSGIACSLAFHLPVSTPPNAIVSGYANIDTKYMAVAGILPSFWGLLFMALNGNFWHPVIYGDATELPTWAVRKNKTE